MAGRYRLAAICLFVVAGLQAARHEWVWAAVAAAGAICFAAAAAKYGRD